MHNTMLISCFIFLTNHCIAQKIDESPLRPQEVEEFRGYVLRLQEDISRDKIPMKYPSDLRRALEICDAYYLQEKRPIRIAYADATHRTQPVHKKSSPVQKNNSKKKGTRKKSSSHTSIDALLNSDEVKKAEIVQKQSLREQKCRNEEEIIRNTFRVKKIITQKNEIPKYFEHNWLRCIATLCIPQTKSNHYLSRPDTDSSEEEIYVAIRYFHCLFLYGKAISKENENLTSSAIKNQDAELRDDLIHCFSDPTTGLHACYNKPLNKLSIFQHCMAISLACLQKLENEKLTADTTFTEYPMFPGEVVTIHSYNKEI